MMSVPIYCYVFVLILFCYVIHLQYFVLERIDLLAIRIIIILTEKLDGREFEHPVLNAEAFKILNELITKYDPPLRKPGTTATERKELFDRVDNWRKNVISFNKIKETIK